MFADRDALSAALDQLGFRCLVLDALAARPWRREFLRDAISVHLVLQGSCLLDVDFPVWRYRLDEGELLVVNRGTPGALRSSSDADSPEVLSARVHLEAPAGHPMLAGFPRLLRTRAGAGPASFASTMSAMREELSCPLLGGRAIAKHLCEALFIQALRSHVADQSWNDRGWFRMLADPLVREQLGALERPGATLEGIAALAGRSRQRTDRAAAQNDIGAVARRSGRSGAGAGQRRGRGDGIGHERASGGEARRLAEQAGDAAGIDFVAQKELTETSPTHREASRPGRAARSAIMYIARNG